MKKFLIFAVMLAVQVAAMADNRISGRLLDDNDNSALTGANVVLQADTSKVISGSVTDETGRFEIKDVDAGSYVLRFSCLGYELQSVSLANLDDDIDVGEIRLVPTVTALGEVVVEGSAVINKIDRQIILPTSAQRNASTNGISLLQHLQVASLVINPLDKSIKTNLGDEVQLRINGVVSDKNDVMALHPADIVRIEYHDNPGLKYGDAAAVVDYIVKRKETGGNVAADLMNGIKPLGAGDYNISARYNRNKSVVGAVFSWERRDLEWTRENRETFVCPGQTVENKEIGNPTKIKYDRMNLNLSYNYADDKNMLNVAFRNIYNNTPNSFYDRNSVLYQDGTAYNITNKQKEKSYIPSLDVYYQRSMKNNQNLYVDVVGTYIESSSDRHYSMSQAGMPADEIVSMVDGERYSIIGEAIYEKQFDNGTLTAGGRHSQSSMNNVYDGNLSSKVDMNQAETYVFAEFQSSVKRLNYRIGIGGMRTYYEQEGLSQEKYIFRPTLSLSYNFRDKVFMRYNAEMSGYAPSLADLSDVTQAMDLYQVRRGNPALHSVTYYTQSLMASWRSRYVNVELFGRYSYDDNPMMEETLYEDGMFVRTTANQRGFHRLNLQATVQVMPFKEYIMIRLTPFFNRYISLGNGYTHTHSNPGFRGSIMGMYKNWSMMIEMNTSYHTLWGETLQKEEKLHSIAVGYNTEKWGVQMMLMNPFTKRYEQSVENRSRLAPYSQVAYSDDFKRMVMVNVSVNLDFGRQRNAAGKRINNSDTDTGILSGNK